MRIVGNNSGYPDYARLMEGQAPTNEGIQSHETSISNRHISVVNDMRDLAAIFQEDSALVESVRRALGLTDRDNVSIFVVPKGQNRVPVGSFLNSNTSSSRTQRLNVNIRSAKSRLRELENGMSDPQLTSDERARSANSMRRSIEEYARELAGEMARLAAMPRSGVVVVEREQ